jgi:phosphatidylglycerol:prolipoprotein diacylglycerol transferase
MRSRLYWRTAARRANSAHLEPESTVRPILVNFGGVSVYSHSVFVVLGVIVALWFAWRIARRKGRTSPQLLWIVSGGMVGAAFMARFGLALRYVLLPGDASVRGLLEYGGQTLLGGLAGAWIGVVLMKRLIGYSRDTGDILVPGVALGIAIGRIGCFLAERPGTPTTLRWGVHVPAEWASRLRDCEGCLTGAAMHPSFLYESAFLAVLAWWLFRVSRRGTLPAPWMVEGDLFRTFLLANAGFRFLVEFVRGNPEMALGLSGSQLLVLPAIVILVALFLRRRRSWSVSTAGAAA